MHIYTSDSDFIIRGAYLSKEWLKDSFARTERGMKSSNNQTRASSCLDVLIGRVESAAAAAIVLISGSFLVFTAAIAGPVFLIPLIALNGASRLPGLSSIESVAKFTNDSTGVILRSIKVGFVLPSAAILFFSSSLLNTFIPSLIKADSLILTKLNELAATLGPMITVEAVLPKNQTIIGCENELSFLGALEEYARSLSFKNEYKKMHTDRIYHHYRYSVNR